MILRDPYTITSFYKCKDNKQNISEAVRNTYSVISKFNTVYDSCITDEQRITAFNWLLNLITAHILSLKGESSEEQEAYKEARDIMMTYVQDKLGKDMQESIENCLFA